ncbi:MAG: NAD(P)H-hydrate epimerase [Candidatus Omnitrophota bacterium]
MNDNITLTAAEAAQIDKYAREQLGILPLVLMENAGRGIAEVVLESINKNSRIAIFCGRGNNAGDGFVAARHFITQGQDVDIYLIGNQGRIRNEAETNLSILKKITGRIFGIRDSESLGAINLKDYGIIIDALFGIGLKGEVEGLFKETISFINNNKNQIPVAAVDIPSGMDATTGEVHGIAIRADFTITFFAKKQGLLLKEGPEYSGKIIVKDLGLPVKAYEL